MYQNTSVPPKLNESEAAPPPARITRVTLNQKPIILGSLGSVTGRVKECFVIVNSLVAGSEGTAVIESKSVTTPAAEAITLLRSVPVATCTISSLSPKVSAPGVGHESFP